MPGVKNEPAEAVREQELGQIKSANLKQTLPVERVDYNYGYTGSYTPRNPKFRKQWGLKKTGFSESLEQDPRQRGSDSSRGLRGRRWTPDLRYKIAARYDFVNRNRTVEDPHGHGTHVAGIARSQRSTRRAA